MFPLLLLWDCSRDGPRVPSHELGHGDTLAAAVGTIQSPIRSLSGKVLHLSISLYDFPHICVVSVLLGRRDDRSSPRLLVV